MRSKEVKHMYFEYGNEELAVLRRDKRMCEVIDRVGHIYRYILLGRSPYHRAADIDKSTGDGLAADAR